MLEMISLVLFGLIVYTILVVVPAVVEKMTSEDFKQSYFSYLSSIHVNSFGK